MRIDSEKEVIKMAMKKASLEGPWEFIAGEQKNIPTFVVFIYHI